MPSPLYACPATRAGAILLVGLVIGCGGTPTDETGPDVAKWVIAKGGKVVLHGSDRKLAGLGQIPEGKLAITEIDLTGLLVNDKDLERLTELDHLQALNLYQTKVTDAGLDSVAKLVKLRSLELSYTAITDKGLAKLTGLRGLKKLFVYGTAVSDEAVADFEKQVSGVTIER